MISDVRRYALPILGLFFGATTTPALAAEQVRVAVIGGVELCGVWDRLVPRIEAATGLRIETIVAGPKDSVVPAFRKGQADVLLIHGSDESLALLFEGVSGPMRAWAANEHVIVGPADDPAGVASVHDGAQAMERIASTRSAFVAFRDPGSHGVVQRLMRRAGLRASSEWLLVDETLKSQDILSFAADRHAYVVVGHIPVAFGKMQADNMKVLLSGDPVMRRPYVVLEPGPNHPAGGEARLRAKRLADYLVSDRGQSDLLAADADAGGPWLYPLPRAVTEGAGKDGSRRGR